MKGIISKAFVVTLLCSQIAIFGMDGIAQPTVAAVAEVTPAITEAVSAVTEVAQAVPVVTETVSAVATVACNAPEASQTVRTIIDNARNGLNSLAKHGKSCVDWTIESMKAHPENWFAGAICATYVGCVGYFIYTDYQRNHRNRLQA